MAFQFQITFTNYSQQTLSLGYAHYAQGGQDDGGIQTSPSTTLMAVQGQEILSAYQKMLSSVAEGWLEIYCTWVLTGANPLRFGVLLHFPAQVFGMGSDPYWKIMYDTNAVAGSADPSPSWIKSGKHPGDPYTWPSSLPLKITGRPTATGDSLLVEVTIEDPDPSPST